MNTVTPAVETSRPSRFKAVARAVLHSMSKVMPTSLYESFYSYAFRKYRERLRAQYHKKVEEARRTGDAQALARGERVYAVMPYSLVGATGLELTHDLAKHAVDEGLEGSFVECGVAGGGCAALIAMVAQAEGKHRHCWFFDSYEGLPDPTEADFADGKTGEHVRPLPKGSCLGTEAQVRELLFKRFKLSESDITLVKGWFQDTLPETKGKLGPIALLRLDGDWYESTKCCLEQLYDQVVEGGFVLIDDYDTCYGSAKATDEFRAARSITTDLIPDGRGGRAFQKPSGTN